MEAHYSLPFNVALITLQELVDGSVLVRLAHLYEAGEDPDYSKLAKVELKKMFAGKRIKTLKETSLSANQDKSEMTRKAWKVDKGVSLLQSEVALWTSRVLLSSLVPWRSGLSS